jgi:hypothetical protein
MKNLKTFVISKFQIAALRNEMIANGIPAEEVEKMSGADLALRWKSINLENIGSKTQKDAFAKQYPFLAGYDLIAQVAPAKEATTEIPAEAVAEMTTPEPAPTKSKNKKATA